MARNLADFVIPQDSDLRRAFACIDKNHTGIALVVDDELHLLGTVTDGDIRRVILAGGTLDKPVAEVLANKADPRFARPITAPAGTSAGELTELLRSHSIHQLPILDDVGRVVDVVTVDDLFPDEAMGISAVVMAGGLGTRLQPLTQETPKPMLQVGDRPLLEHTIGTLRRSGIRQVIISTYYEAEKITEHFGEGEDFDVAVRYVKEEKPLGTAGALGLIEPPDEPLLVINGDILTQVDFRAMLDFHREQQADLTVGVREYEFKVPYGVLSCDGPWVTEVREKPTYSFFVNAGIYLMQPSAHALIPAGEHFNMTDLITVLADGGGRVASFPIVEYWLDIGEHDDYVRAGRDFEAGKVER